MEAPFPAGGEGEGPLRSLTSVHTEQGQLAAGAHSVQNGLAPVPLPS